MLTLKSKKEIRQLMEASCKLGSETQIVIYRKILTDFCLYNDSVLAKRINEHLNNVISLTKM